MGCGASAANKADAAKVSPEPPAADGSVDKADVAKVNPEPPAMDGSVEEVDVLLIGAGFTGCWFADKLRARYSADQLSVAMVEMSHRVGGRLMSDDNDGSGSIVKDELGGMRLFPSKMPRIAALVERFGLDVVPLSLADEGNLFHFHGGTGRKKDAKMPTGGRWAGCPPSDMSKAAVAAYKATEAWAACGQSAYACPELRELSVPAFLAKYAEASEEEVACYFALSGYNLYHGDVQAAIMVHASELYGSALSEHHFVRQGYMEVVKRLQKASGVEPRMETKVASLSRRESDGRVVATLEGKHAGTIAAKKVLVGVTAAQLARIRGWDKLVSRNRAAAVQASKHIPLFKCFLDFPKPWWQAHGFVAGKSVTDTDVRQIHYYDDEDLLLYVSDGDSEATRYASHLGEAFKADKEKALRDAWSVVKKVHAEAGVPEEDMVEPSYARCVHAYWEAGSHKWRVGADVRQCVASVADGSADGSQVYLAGDAFCDMQGWVEGAIDVAEQAFAKAFPKDEKALGA